jgi:FRG domain
MCPAIDPAILTRDELKRFAKVPVKCPLLRVRITSLADYLAVVSDAIRTDDTFWYRGHPDKTYTLTPSALRYSSYSKRARALALMPQFKRIAEIKLSRPKPDDELLWALIAQHYGLPTRLLDWTESATTALYFACAEDHCDREECDGLIYMLNPVDLNRLSYPGRARILEPQEDEKIISSYLKMGARHAKRGRYPVALNPVWNSDRIMIQRGVFTLHGKRFDLDGAAIPSLAAIPILRESKPRLRKELQRIGVDEMTLFPELEHACAHLKRNAGLGAK